MGRLLSHEMERFWEEAVVDKFELPSWHMTGGAETNRESPIMIAGLRTEF